MTDKGYTVYTHKVIDEERGPIWYVGVTKQRLCQRWRADQYTNSSLEPYILKYGWSDIEHRAIANGLDRETALKLEDFLILMYRSADCCINRNRSGLIELEDKNGYEKRWREEHRAERSEYNRQWRETHREEQLNYKNEYNKRNRSTIEGKIYYRVYNFNKQHPDRVAETPREARDKYLESGYIPKYVKHNDLH